MDTPSLYILNAAALSKPHATKHLGADLTSNDVDVAVITEIHFKAKHSDNVVGVQGYTLSFCETESVVKVEASLYT